MAKSSQINKALNIENVSSYLQQVTNMDTDENLNSGSSGSLCRSNV